MTGFLFQWPTAALPTVDQIYPCDKSMIEPQTRLTSRCPRTR